MVKFKRGMRSINKAVVELVETKLNSSDLDNHGVRSKLVSWINGVAAPERNPELKAELLRIRHELQKMG